MATAVIVRAEVRTRVIETVASEAAVIILIALFNTLLMSPSHLMFTDQIAKRAWIWSGGWCRGRSRSRGRSE